MGRALPEDSGQFPEPHVSTRSATPVPRGSIQYPSGFSGHQALTHAHMQKINKTKLKTKMSNINVKKKELLAELGVTPLILLLGKQTSRALRVQDLPGLYNCLKTTTKPKKKNLQHNMEEDLKFKSQQTLCKHYCEHI